MRKHITRLTNEGLLSEARRCANDLQKPVLEKLIINGWTLHQVWTFEGRSAIGVNTPDGGGWLTPDGKFHRPVRGKSKVSINLRTLERVW